MTQYEIDHLACSLTVSARPCPAGHERARPLVEPGPGPGATREIEPPPGPFRHTDVGGDELWVDWPPVLHQGSLTVVRAVSPASGTAVEVHLTYDAVRRLSGQLDILLGKPWLRSRQPEPARVEPAGRG